jgi:DNA-binding NarL/FixJ family response regulator
VIAEDSVLLRVGLVKVLETAGFEIVAEVGDADALLAAVERHQPELAVVDVRMPPGFTDDGIRAALAIRRQWPARPRSAAAPETASGPRPPPGAASAR